MSWLVLRMTQSAVLLALVTTFSFGPSLVVGPMAGSLVDRYDRRHLLLVTQSAFCVLALGFGALQLAGLARVWVIFAFALANGFVSAADSPARQVFVLDLVGPGRTANAVALNEVVINTSRVLGPAVGAVLLATAGAAVCFFFNAVSYFPPLAVVIALLARQGWASAHQDSAGRHGHVRHVRQGLAYAWHKPAIRSCLLFAVAGGMLFNMGTTLPLMATRAFRAGAGTYGSMMAAFGAGALFGAVFAGSSPWPRSRHVRALVLATGIEVCLAAAAPWIGLLYAGLVLAGMLSIWYISLANALVQLRAEPGLRGRVMGAWTMALPGMGPFTSLLAGALASWGGGGLGAREAFGLAGVAMVASAAVGWRSLADEGPRTGAAVVLPEETGPALAAR